MSEDAAGPDLHAMTDRIARFERDLDAACRAAGRNRDGVSLIAITKHHPAEVAAHAVRCGLVDLGENKAQELAAKRERLLELPAGTGEGQLPRQPVWHFVGRLQRNKVKQVVASADLIHSIDRVALAEAVVRAVDASERWAGDRRLGILLQVDLDPERRPGDQDSTASRGGVHPDDVAALAEVIAASPRLDLAGVMAVAPLGLEPGPCFARLAEVSQRLRRDHPGAVAISAGMTQDYPVALEHGATMIRVGTALFGDRPQH